MTDIPIIFSAPMVRALLDGSKTMTRRLAWGKPIPGLYESDGGPLTPILRRSPWQKVAVGDRLWVRETWQLHSRATDYGTVVYRASIDGSWTEAHEMVSVERLVGKRLQPKPFQLGWRSPLHLFRELSRLTLLVTGTNVERLQDISRADVMAEGIHERDGQPMQGVHAGWHEPFAELWTKLHGAESWDTNPEVVVISFRVIRANIDAPEALAA